MISLETIMISDPWNRPANKAVIKESMVNDGQLLHEKVDQPLFVMSARLILWNNWEEKTPTIDV